MAKRFQGTSQADGPVRSGTCESSGCGASNEERPREFCDTPLSRTQHFGLPTRFHALLLGLCLLLPNALRADPLPKDIFLLVDVSGSMVGSNYGIGYGKVQEARNLVRDLLTDRFDWSRYPNWQYSLLAEEILGVTSQAPNHAPLLQPGSRLFIKRFGDPATSKAPSIQRPISNVVTDVDTLLGRFPRAADFDDQRTFLWLARAMTRREAMALGITSYLLIEITDAREDKENIVDPTDQVAVREFKSLKHVPINGEIGSFSHKQTKGEYVLQVNVRLVRLAGDTGAASTSNALISNLQIPQGLREGDDAVISWDSFNAPGGISYTASLTPSGGQPIEETTQSQQVTFPALKAGDYAVAVSAPGANALRGQFQVGAAGSAPAVPSSNKDSGGSEIILQTPRRDAEIQTGSVTVSWRVINPPSGGKYIVTITGPPGAPKIPKKSIDGTRASFSVRKSGTYRIRVASTQLGVKPASGTFRVKNDSGKKLLYAILALIPLGIVTYIAAQHFKKRRHGKDDDFDSYAEDLD